MMKIIIIIIHGRIVKDNIYSSITKTNQRATKEDVLKMDVKKVVSEIEMDNDFFGW